MTFDDTLFLAADTLRSRAYAQALQASGIRPGGALLITSKTMPRFGQSDTPPAPPPAACLPEFFVPDLRIPLAKTCRALTRDCETLKTGTINDPTVAESIVRRAPRLIIYSGFGGEIVAPDMLECSPPMLHLHAGWLPNYRGSTTMYYSMLCEENCAVSALLLQADIDTGHVLARRRYPLPPPGIDTDYLYDGIIRADLLVRVLEHRHRTNALPEPQPQNNAEATTYYIIHPVLKHIAQLTVDNAAEG